MSTSFTPVIGHAFIELRLDPRLQGRLSAMAAGRPLVIDYYASRLRGVVIGDLTVSFGMPPGEPCFIELTPLDGVVVLVHRRLVDLLDGAILREGGVAWFHHIVVTLLDPTAWIDFLDRSGTR